MMANGKHTALHKATSSVTSGQKPTFYRRMNEKAKEKMQAAWENTVKAVALTFNYSLTPFAKFAYEHKLLAVTLFLITFGAGKVAYSQSNDVTPVKNTNYSSNLIEPDSSMTPAGKTGEETDKYRAVTLKDGILNWEGKGSVNIQKELKRITGKENLSDADARKIDTTLENVGRIIYFVFENAVLSCEAKGNNLHYRGEGVSDKLFTHEGALFISKNGSIFAVSPTAFITVNYGDLGSGKLVFKDEFGPNTPNLVRPIYSQGKNDDWVDLRDEAMGDLKMEISIISTKWQTVKDDKPIGTR